MLDFNKLMQQIDQVGQESLEESLAEHETLLNAHEAFDQAVSVAEQFTQRLCDNQATTLWPVAVPLERFGNSQAIEPQHEPVTVVAADGSQIMPSHHEVHSCYLLNVGLVTVTYGSKHPPLLETVPQLFHRPEDLYPLVDRRRLHIDELYVSLERTLMELQTLLQRALAAQQRGAPVVALYDGSLISWSLDKLPEGYHSNYTAKMVSLLDQFRVARIPIFGYLSYSRSSDVVNSLRLSVCPYEKSRCREHCGHLNEEDFPCSTIWPLSDRQLLHGKLSLNHRCPIFASGSLAMRSMPPQHKICFTYMNVGDEIARLELPFWLTADGTALKTGLATVLAQCQKGTGYPVCLSEAHHLAVIRGRDREAFFDLITQHLIGLGSRRIRVSPKESKKRTGFV